MRPPLLVPVESVPASHDDRANAAPPFAVTSLQATLAHAVVGLGRFGAIHARKIDSLPGFRLHAVADHAPAARPGAEHVGLPLLHGVDELPPGIHSATVATSSESHAEVAIALMRRGCHVLVEKPLCIDRQDGAAMIRTAQQFGVTLCTGHIERFNPVLDDAFVAGLRRAAKRHPGSASPFLRFRRSSRRGGSATDSVLDLMVHDLDLFAWICAIPTDAPLQVMRRQIDGQIARVQVRLGGLVAELESSYDSGPATAQMQACNDDGAGPVVDLRDHPVASAGDDAMARQYRDFHRAVQGQGRRIASAADGLAAVIRAHQVLHA